MSKYKESGVDIDEGNRFVSLIKPKVKKTNIPGVAGNVGSFGGVFDLKIAGGNAQAASNWKLYFNPSSAEGEDEYSNSDSESSNNEEVLLATGSTFGENGEVLTEAGLEIFAFSTEASEHAWNISFDQVLGASIGTYENPIDAENYLEQLNIRLILLQNLALQLFYPL